MGSGKRMQGINFEIILEMGLGIGITRWEWNTITFSLTSSSGLGFGWQLALKSVMGTGGDR